MLRKRQRAARHEQQSGGDTADLQQVVLHLSQVVLHACHAMPCINNLFKHFACKLLVTFA